MSVIDWYKLEGFMTIGIKQETQRSMHILNFAGSAWDTMSQI